MELRRAQQQELRVLRAQFERRLRETSYGCRQEVHRAHSSLSEAEAVAEQAEERRRGAEACAGALAQKVADLREHLRKRGQSADASVEALQRMMDARLQRVTAQTEARISSMAGHAKAVCTLSKSAVEGVTEELQGQLARAHVRSEGRVRFRELCQLAGTYGNYDVSKDAYYTVKAELINLWHVQKAGRPLVQPAIEQPPADPAAEPAGPE